LASWKVKIVYNLALKSLYLYIAIPKCDYGKAVLKKVKLWTIYFMAFLVTSLFFSPNSYAYLDPGSGSYLFQIIIAALLSVSFLLKAFWQRIKLFFSGLFSEKRKGQKKS